MIRTAVFPVAGRGSRMQPATSAVPKELLPVYDTPLLQFAIDEARDAGIERFVFVTSHDKPAIEAYVRAEHEDLDSLFVIQEAPLGLGHAILTASGAVENEPFAVILPDDVIAAEKPCLRQMVEAYEETGGCMVAAMEVPRAKTASYGVLDVEHEKGSLVRAKGMVEKPDPAEAPSTLAVIGRYILTPHVLENLDRKKVGAGGEIQLTDAIAEELAAGRPVHGLRFSGTRFDCGSKSGFLQATVAFALAREDLHDDLMGYLREVMGFRSVAE